MSLLTICTLRKRKYGTLLVFNTLFFVCLSLSSSGIAQDEKANNETFKNCLYDDDFSRAMGVLLYDQVIESYRNVINPEEFFYGITEHYVNAISGEPIAVKVEVRDSEGSAESLPSREENVEWAESVLNSWLSDKKYFDEKYNVLSGYKTRYTPEQTDLGVLFRKRDDAAFDDEFSKNCMTERKKHTDFASGAKVDSTWVCTQEHKIDRHSKCRISEDESFKGLDHAADELKVDFYDRNLLKQYTNVSQAWVEVLEELNNASDDTVLEFMIPTELLLRSGKVDSTEPMWFLAKKIPESTTP